MAFTAPRTWTDGELVTKAIMDPHVRDNFLAMYPHLIVRKTSDETVTSSTVLQDDNQLILPLLANEIWKFEFNLIYSADAAGDIQISFTFPAAGRIDASVFWNTSGSAADIIKWSGTTTPATAQNLQGLGSTIRLSLPIQGIFTNSSTAGNLTLQWAQTASSATATTVYTNSTLWAVKLA